MPHAQQRHAVEVVDLDRRAHDVEHARQEAHRHPRRLRLPDEVEHVLGRLLRGLDDDAVHVELAGEHMQLRAGGGDELGIGGRAQRHAPDELGTTIADVELVGEPLEGLVAADEQAAFRPDRLAHEPARDPARGDGEHEERHPEHDHLAGPDRTGEQLLVKDEDEQREERRELKELGRLVDRALVEHELVALVHPLDLAREDDERKRQERREMQAVV